MPLIKSEVKLQKKDEIKDLEAKKQQRKYHLTYLDVSKIEKRYD